MWVWVGVGVGGDVDVGVDVGAGVGAGVGCARVGGRWAWHMGSTLAIWPALSLSETAPLGPFGLVPLFPDWHMSPSSIAPPRKAGRFSPARGAAPPD